MAQAQIQASQEVGESIQGNPVGAGMRGDVRNAQPQKNKDSSKTNKKVISSVDLPSQSNSKKKDDSSENESDNKDKKPKRWWLWLIIVLFVLGAGAAAYFFFLKDMV